MSALVSVSLASACSVVAKPLLLRDIFHFITPVIVDQGKKLLQRWHPVTVSSRNSPSVMHSTSNVFECSFVHIEYSGYI